MRRSSDSKEKEKKTSLPLPYDLACPFRGRVFLAETGPPGIWQSGSKSPSMGTAGAERGGRFFCSCFAMAALRKGLKHQGKQDCLDPGDSVDAAGLARIGLVIRSVGHQTQVITPCPEQHLLRIPVAAHPRTALDLPSSPFQQPLR